MFDLVIIQMFLFWTVQVHALVLGYPHPCSRVISTSPTTTSPAAAATATAPLFIKRPPFVRTTNAAVTATVTATVQYNPVRRVLVQLHLATHAYAPVDICTSRSIRSTSTSTVIPKPWHGMRRCSTSASASTTTVNCSSSTSDQENDHDHEPNDYHDCNQEGVHVRSSTGVDMGPRSGSGTGLGESQSQTQTQSAQALDLDLDLDLDSEDTKNVNKNLDTDADANANANVTKITMERDRGMEMETGIENESTLLDEKPRYKSKLQRLNQLQKQKNVRMTKKRTKLKNRNANRYGDDDDDGGDGTIGRGSQSLPPPPPPPWPSLNMDMDTDTNMDTNMEFNLDLNEEYGIDSFLRGEYDRPFADDAAAPLPNHTPGQIVEIALTSLRALDVPTTDHGAAVFMRFCAPLTRGDRWGGTGGGSSNSGSGSGNSSGTNSGTNSGIAMNAWKAIMRGSLTPTMLARRIRASEDFAVLLDWEQLDVTEGTTAIPNAVLGLDSTIAFVNAALFFEDGTEPSMCQFTLKLFNGVWLIDSAVISRNEWFMD